MPRQGDLARPGRAESKASALATGKWRTPGESVPEQGLPSVPDDQG